MRLLHIADVHLERPFSRMAPASGARRRALLRSSFERAMALGVDRQVDAICIAGDLFERENSTIEVGQYLRGLFSRLWPVPILIAPGNHDYYCPGCLYDRVDWPDNVHIFRASCLEALPVGDGVVVGTAFTTADESGQLALPNVERDRPHVGLFHADLVGGSASASAYRPVRRDDLAASGLAFAMLGHQHSALLDRQARAAYTGSIEPLDRTESGARWVHILDVDSTGARSEHVEVAASRVVEITVDIAGVTSAADLARKVDGLTAPHGDDYVLLTLSGERTGELALDWSGAVGAIAGSVASIDDRTDALGDWRRYLGEKSVRGRFVRSIAADLEGAGEDTAGRSRLLDELGVGLAALEGRRALPL